jgi:hypothetical protein
VSASERTGWRDDALSVRHRAWGQDCPAVDLDFLLIEYDQGVPVALGEYKHFKSAAWPPDVRRSSVKAVLRLANGFRDGGIPFFICRYWPVPAWRFEPMIVNRQRFPTPPWPEGVIDEATFVAGLYRLRGRNVPEDLKLDRSETDAELICPRCEANAGEVLDSEGRLICRACATRRRRKEAAA